jgi:hypothetical protein
MLNLDLVKQTIAELENSETTMQNCQKLSALYTILNQHSVDTADVVKKELSDILPEYETYRSVKCKYKEGVITKETVQIEMAKLCKELHEFIETLYSCSDMPEERTQLLETLNLSILHMRGN